MNERKIPRLVRGGDQIRAQVPEGWYTRAMVVLKTSASMSTLKRWHAGGQVIPSGFMNVGKNRVWLYSQEDIEDIERRLAL